MIKTHQVKIKPNKVMKQWIHELFAYRRWCWNYGLGLWNDFYEESLIFEDKTLRPNGNKVRDFMVSRKMIGNIYTRLVYFKLQLLI